MKPNARILDENIGRLLRRAYVPAVPDPAFRRRLEETFAIEVRRLARERSVARRPAARSSFPRRRVTTLVAGLAAALLFIALGTWIARSGAITNAPGRDELLARGDVALHVGAAGWRAADPDELARGIALGPEPLEVATPTDLGLRITARAGRVDVAPLSFLRASAEAAGNERFLLATGAAVYTGPGGEIALEVGEELRLIGGIPEGTELALADSVSPGGRRPVEEPPDAGVRPAPDPGATLRGVVRGPDGAPIPRFRIGILQTRIGNEYRDPETRDFEGGAFTWSGITPGDYRVFAHAAGLALCDLGMRTLTDEVELDVRLLRGGTVRGHVVDRRTGNPVPDALVLSEEDAPQDGLTFQDTDRMLWLPAATRTLADGSFEIAHLTPGAHTLRVSAPGHGAAWTEPITVASEAIVDGILVELDAGGAVEGRVTRSDGAPWTGVEVVVPLMNQEIHPQMNFGLTWTDADGRYRVEDLPPELVLVVLADTPRPVVKPVQIEAGKTVRVDFLGQRAGTRLFGHLVDATGEPIGNQNVALFDQSADWSHSAEQFEATTTLPDGSYAFEGVAAGAYLLYMVEDMGRWTRLIDRIEVPDWAELQHDVRVLGLEIEGTVTDGQTAEPAPETSLVLEMQDPESDGILYAGNTLSDADGRYSFGLLNPGRYRVAAYPTGHLGFQKSGLVVLDESSPSVELDLPLAPGGSVEVLVVDADGGPIARAAVLLVDESGDAFTTSQFPATDERGRYVATGVCEGRYRALVRADGFQGSPVAFECRAGEQAHVRVELVRDDERNER